MHPIPPKLRGELQSDPYYQVCARQNDECDGRITWEHAMTYAGRQVQEGWAILPLCIYHHLGAGLVKRINVELAMARATEADRQKYPRLSWRKHLTA